MNIHKLPVVTFATKLESKSNNFGKQEYTNVREKQKCTGVVSKNEYLENDERAGGDTNTTTSNKISKPLKTDLKKRTRSNIFGFKNTKKFNNYNESDYRTCRFKTISNRDDIADPSLNRQKKFKECRKENRVKETEFGKETSNVRRTKQPIKHEKRMKNSKLQKDIFGFRNIRRRRNDSCIYQLSCDYLNVDKLPKTLKKQFCVKQRGQNHPHPKESQAFYNLHHVKVIKCHNNPVKNVEYKNACVSPSVHLTPCRNAACGSSKSNTGLRKRKESHNEDHRNKQKIKRRIPCTSGRPGGTYLTDLRCNRAQLGNTKIFRTKLVSGLVKSVMNLPMNELKQQKSKQFIKKAFIGFILILWSPCLLATYLVWVASYPIKILCKRVLRRDPHERSFNHPQKKGKGLLSSIKSWQRRIASTTAEYFQKIVKVLKPNKNNNISMRPFKQPNPRKRYQLYYECERGWRLKPLCRRHVRNKLCQVCQKPPDASCHMMTCNDLHNIKLATSLCPADYCPSIVCPQLPSCSSPCPNKIEPFCSQVTSHNCCIPRTQPCKPCTKPCKTCTQPCKPCTQPCKPCRPKKKNKRQQINIKPKKRKRCERTYLKSSIWAQSCPNKKDQINCKPHLTYKNILWIKRRRAVRKCLCKINCKVINTSKCIYRYVMSMFCPCNDCLGGRTQPHKNCGTCYPGCERFLPQPQERCKRRPGCTLVALRKLVQMLLYLIIFLLTSPIIYCCVCCCNMLFRC